MHLMFTLCRDLLQLFLLIFPDQPKPASVVCIETKAVKSCGVSDSDAMSAQPEPADVKLLINSYKMSVIYDVQLSFIPKNSMMRFSLQSPTYCM